MPTMPGTFSVPDRMPRSCPPPCIWIARRTRGPRRRTYIAPTPLGPWNLWPDRLSRSIPIASTSIGTFPTACVASVWNSTPASFATAPISATG